MDLFLMISLLEEVIFPISPFFLWNLWYSMESIFHASGEYSPAYFSLSSLHVYKMKLEMWSTGLANNHHTELCFLSLNMKNILPCLESWNRRTSSKVRMFYEIQVSHVNFPRSMQFRQTWNYPIIRSVPSFVVQINVTLCSLRFILNQWLFP